MGEPKWTDEQYEAEGDRCYRNGALFGLAFSAGGIIGMFLYYWSR